MTENNPVSLDTLAAALAAAMGVAAPEHAAPANETIMNFLDGRKADRLFMYNPDAIGQWVREKYPYLFKEVDECPLHVPFATVMPSVTPVCFGTMYTGAQPAVHGIRKYEKPVIKIESLFDTMIKAGKRCAIVADRLCSMGKIYLERDMDYYIFDTLSEINAKVYELIREDRYDMIAVYNANYDSVMHKNGTESIAALAEARSNSHVFGEFREAIRNNWKGHNTLIGFAMDHGCHDIDAGCGAHGLDMPEDINILHSYDFIEKSE